MPIFKNIIKTMFFLTLTVLLSSCGPLKPDWSKTAEPDGRKRAQQNVLEGRGFNFGTGKKRGGDFLFASSNPMWRASLEILDFMSLSNVDYAGGLIITDWYSEDNPNEAVKITIRFLSNEIRADGLKIDIHKKICSNLNCTVKKIDSNLTFEIKDKILRKAAVFEKEQKKTGVNKVKKSIYENKD